MSESVHLSADVSKMLEGYSKKTGIKESELAEEAIRIYVMAREAEIPASVVIPPVAVLTASSAEKVMERLSRPAKPSRALQEVLKACED